jgi:ABC-type uncharacterized transport system substrate-binding protein
LTAQRFRLSVHFRTNLPATLVLANPAEPDSRSRLHYAQGAAHALQVSLHVLEVQSREDLAHAFAAIQRERIGAFLVLSDPLLLGQFRSDIVDFALRHRLPAMYSARVYVEAGGLMSYAPSFPAMWQRAASYVDRILKGTTPAALPVEQPTTFELVLNLKTAQALGLAIPPLPSSRRPRSSAKPRRLMSSRRDAFCT